MDIELLKTAISRYGKWESLEEEVRSYGDEYRHTEECNQCTREEEIARTDFCSAFRQLMHAVEPEPGAPIAPP